MISCKKGMRSWGIRSSLWEGVRTGWWRDCQPLRGTVRYSAPWARPVPPLSAFFLSLRHSKLFPSWGSSECGPLCLTCCPRPSKGWCLSMIPIMFGGLSLGRPLLTPLYDPPVSLCPHCLPHILFFLINFYWSIVVLQCILVSAVQQNESVIHIHIITPSLLEFLPIQVTTEH